MAAYNPLMGGFTGRRQRPTQPPVVGQPVDTGPRNVSPTIAPGAVKPRQMPGDNNPNKLKFRIGVSDPTAGMADALEDDTNRMQAAADEQYGRLDEVVGAMGQRLGADEAAIRGIGEEEAARLRGLGDEHLNEIRADNARIQAEFKNLTAQQVQATTQGMVESMEQQKQQILNDPMLQPQQKQQQISMLNRQVKTDVANQVATIGARYNEANAQLATALQGQKVDTMQMRAGLYTQAAELQRSALMGSIEYAMNGLMGVYNLIQQNPRTVVSRYAGKAEMFKNWMTMAAVRSGDQAMFESNWDASGQPWTNTYRSIGQQRADREAAQQQQGAQP